MQSDNQNALIGVGNNFLQKNGSSDIRHSEDDHHNMSIEYVPQQAENRVSEGL